VERNNKQTCVKLFAENTSSLKNGSSAPIASFIAKLIVSLPPNQQTIVHPGKLLLLINLFDKKFVFYEKLLSSCNRNEHYFGKYRKWGHV
jgi:hypothetical protein